MNKQTNFVSLLLEENALSLGYLKQNLRFLDESQLFHMITEKSEKSDVVSLINTKLHSPGDGRLKALLLLEKFLSQCPSDIFSDYSTGWMQQCCKWNQRTINDELRILANLIRKSVFNPDLKKQIGSTVLPRFVDQINNIDASQNSPQTVILKLICIETFIECYSSSCGPHKNMFYKYTMYCLQEFQNHNAIINEAASCFVSICECGTKGQQSLNFKETWSTQFKLLIETCHQLFDSIYSNVNYVDLVSVERSGNIIQGLLGIESKSEMTPLRRFNEYKIQFSVIGELLKAMLLCKFSASKSFQPNDIFNLVCRILSVTGNVLDKCVQTTDIIALKANLPDIHEITFEILNALIVCAKENLIPCGALICKLCLQSLKWTQSVEWTYGSTKPFESLRCEVYSVLSLWLAMAGTSSFVEVFADDLVPLIISDIEYIKPSVKLTVTTTSKNKKNKRKRGQLVTEMNMQSDSNILIDDSANNNVCSSAHKTLQALIQSASTLIKWEHHKNIQFVVLPILLEIFDSQTSAEYPLPYSDPQCRLQLFQTLMALINHPHPKWTAPLSLAIRISTLGSCDPNPQIASFCKKALSQIEVMVHPRCATLYFPLESCGNTTAKERSEWLPSDIQTSGSSTSRMDVEMEITDKSEAVHKQFDISAGNEKANTNTSAEIAESEVFSVSKSVANESKITDSKENSPHEITNVVASVASDDKFAKQTAIKFSSRFNDSVNENDAQFSTVAEIHQMSEEPPIKKIKAIIIEENEDQEKLQTMLSDFVDTLE